MILNQGFQNSFYCGQLNCETKNVADIADLFITAEHLYMN